MEDAHVNQIGVLEHFDKYLQSGDYVVVEDTNPNMNALVGQGAFEELGWDEFGPVKLNALKEFMKDKSDKYVVDQRYTDFFG